MGTFIFILVLVFVLTVSYIFFLFAKRSLKLRPGNYAVLEYLIWLLLIGTFFAFCFDFSSTKEYYEAIDPIDFWYTPFAGYHLLTLLVFFILSFISLFLVYYRGTHLSPLLLVAAFVFIIIGLILSVAVFIQVTINITNIYDEQRNRLTLYSFFPIVYALTIIIVIFDFIIRESDKSVKRKYSNKILSRINNLLAKANLLPLWIVIFFLPIFLIVTLILVLFGQDSDSIVKVFTQTTTWSFSQLDHPPYLDHMGHYLCTVAACGHPSVVKPLRYGTRHGKPIIVNRQLMVANAFEERIMEISPIIHRIIRRNYDKYGLPVARYINKPLHSDIVYILMKPLEYLFLVSLYLIDINPERRINRQYE